MHRKTKIIESEWHMIANTKESSLEILISQLARNPKRLRTRRKHRLQPRICRRRNAPVSFFRNNPTQPKQMEKLGIHDSEIKRSQFLDRLREEIAKRGIIDVLRNDIKAYPASLIM